MVDDRYPNPDVYLRTALSVPSPSAELDSARRGSGNTHIGDLTTGDLALFEAQRELRAMRDRVRHLEQALKTAGRVLQPYLGNGR